MGNDIVVFYLSMMCGYVLQYMFMFQVPYLPEILMKARDYNLIKRFFLSERMVSILV